MNAAPISSKKNLNVAILSFEGFRHSGGGIATYIINVAKMLSDAGHRIHIFSSGPSAMTYQRDANIVIVEVPGAREHFPEAILPFFRAAHELNPFDVVEGPEYGCDARAVVDTFPDIPFVLRLHGPSFSIGKSNCYYVGWKPRIRFALGAIRRLQLPTDPWRYDSSSDPERIHALQADEIVANSNATATYCSRIWGLSGDRLSVVPLPFLPTTEILTLDPAPRSRIVLFVGRLEVRKGVLELAKAMPIVLRQHPDVTFRLVGRILPHPGDGRLLSHHVIELAKSDAANIEIVGSVPYESIPAELARSSICVFPSDWEASGFACMEGMAAARAVVGSASGGMAEIIDHGRTGLLVEHRAPQAIAAALIELLGCPEKCLQLGAAARASVVDRFAPEAILPMQLAAYERAIANARKRPPTRRYRAD
ncbi:glycosyltransferase [Porphyrobacter sp. SLTP]|uniref:glycosyltransferase family 4 protein n=1 Tax=Porphyrobacter sp. SLTP TaxID=2683266 RepID=UPI0014135A11|nr:glycosyltransferase family 4 protein [Porphyrobacter sp. SLTP]NBB23595.1 glycosyltransferase [Porphyrobacter sp. SLTP]